jgi:Tfx family DNA-binding protein
VGVVLTRRQEEILRLRARGLSQTAVSRMLRTTRENVALIERRVRRRAWRSLELLISYLRAVSATTVTLEKGVTVREAMRMVMDGADRSGVKLTVTSTELGEVIRVLGLAVDGERLGRRLYVFVGYNGNLTVLIGELP